jgi:hypothetical protein
MKYLRMAFFIAGLHGRQQGLRLESGYLSVAVPVLLPAVVPDGAAEGVAAAGVAAAGAGAPLSDEPAGAVGAALVPPLPPRKSVTYQPDPFN